MVQFSNIRMRCKKRGLPCDIDIPFLAELWSRQHGLCCYTGLPMKFARVAQSSYLGGGSKKNDPDMVSVDRVDSDKGYTRTNVVLCRAIVNVMKTDLRASEFYKLIKQIHAHCCITFNR